jgi:hypothetical protein
MLGAWRIFGRRRKLREDRPGRGRFRRHVPGADHHGRVQLPARPAGRRRPRDADDVAATLAACRAHGVPVVARGGGTSIAGQATGTGVVLDFTRHMNGLVSLDPASRTAVVQPGLVLDRLQQAAAPHGLRFGPDPSTHSRCTLGGMIGNNSCGSHSVAWGTTADSVRELSVITARGDRLTPGRTGRAPRRACAPGGGRVGPPAHRLPGPPPPYLGLRVGRPPPREGRRRRPLLLRQRGHAGHPHGGGRTPRRGTPRACAGRAGVRRRERGGGGGGGPAAARAADRRGHGGRPGPLHGRPAPGRRLAVRGDRRRHGGGGTRACGDDRPRGRRPRLPGGDGPGRPTGPVAHPRGRERHGDEDAGRHGGVARLGGLRGAPGPTGPYLRDFRGCWPRTACAARRTATSGTAASTSASTSTC